MLTARNPGLPLTVDVGKDKEHRCADHVNIADEPTVIDVAHDPLDRVEGEILIFSVMHRQKDALMIMITSVIPTSDPKFHQ